MKMKITEICKRIVTWAEENHIFSVCLQLTTLCLMVEMVNIITYRDMNMALEPEWLPMMFLVWLAGANETRRYFCKLLKTIWKLFARFW